MSSAPVPNAERVTRQLRSFFDAEERNTVVMAHGAQTADEIPAPATLGSAHNSLMQAPEDVIVEWFDGDPWMALVEFGQLLGRFGEDAPLDGFVEHGGGSVFVFDVKAWATVAVRADDEDQARQVLRNLTLTGWCHGGEVRTVEPEDGVEPDLVTED